VPLAGDECRVSVATRVDDDSRVALAFRQAADLVTLA
jgi:hypothetical protein